MTGCHSILVAALMFWARHPALAKADASSPPAELFGTWDVEKVEADRQDQMHWGIRPGDPRLLGGELVLTTNSVHFSPTRDDCTEKSWKSISVTWPELFKRGFMRAPMGGRSAHPKPADFDFTPPPTSSQVTAYLLCPNAGKEDPLLTSRWVALTSPDTLVMHKDPQVLLILKRRAADARPRASFSCEKAASPTEKAICGSIELASLDRSVATAYRDASTRDRSRQEDLRKDQKDWLKERDACGADLSCLRKAMLNRVESLTM